MKSTDDKLVNSATQQLRIGLFGFGVVGEGLYKVLQRTPSLNAEIRKICIKDPSKPRNAPAELFTTSRQALLDDNDINVIVEVISDSQAGYEIVAAALAKGKMVVSSSKKNIAENLAQLLQLQRETGQPFLYEASACASIPVIRNLEEYYDNDLLHSVRAIVNGSTNYILTKIFEEKLDFKKALLQAQQLGFAEADPSLDVEGWDAVHKWVILLCHAYGIVAKPAELLFTGIQHIHGGDAAYGFEKGYEIRLVAQAKKLQNGKVAAFVLPQFVKQSDHLAFVKNEYNGVVLESSFSDKQFFYGKGAGSFPTASAVLSDIAALRYGYRYEYKKLRQQQANELSQDFYLRVFLSFDDLRYIPREKLSWVEEWHAGEGRKYLIAVLPYAELLHNNWWQQNNTSLILTPDPIIEDVELRSIKKRSLELAGLV
jgi:homoserine dehydrogenase